VAEFVISDTHQLRAQASITRTVDISTLTSGDYYLWISVEDGNTGPIKAYARNDSDDIVPITVDHSGTFSMTWTPVMTYSVITDTRELYTLWDAFPHPDVDGYVLYAGTTPLSPTIAGVQVAESIETDELGEPVGDPYVIASLGALEPGTYYLMLEAVDEESGQRVRSEEVMVTIPAGTYELTAPQSSYATDAGTQLEIPISLSISEPLYYPKVSLIVEDGDVPPGFLVYFEDDYVSDTFLDVYSDTVNLVVSVADSVADGTYSIAVVGYNNDTEARIDLDIVVGIRSIYLPLISNDSVTAPDLVVEAINVTADNVEITIRNQGSRTVNNAFWVDLYIDPTTPPISANQIWPQLSEEGLVWGIPANTGLAPGNSIRFDLNHDYFASEHSRFSGMFTNGMEIYAQVDSLDADTITGNVLENHEILDNPYNNISQTTVVLP